jgi:preprotein translocase subunit SecG
MLILIVSAVLIIVLVLIQRGKGADAGAGFGAGASGTVFGARGATTALSRATAILAAVFMITCLLLSYVVTRSVRAPESVLDRVNTTDVAPVPVIPDATATQSQLPLAEPAVPATENSPAE